jgi:hypothetical protein
VKKVCHVIRILHAKPEQEAAIWMRRVINSNLICS